MLPRDPVGSWEKIQAKREVLLIKPSSSSLLFLPSRLRTLFHPQGGNCSPSNHSSSSLSSFPSSRPRFCSLAGSLLLQTMAASKAESQKIFEKLKLKPANKVRLNQPPLQSKYMPSLQHSFTSPGRPTLHCSTL